MAKLNKANTTGSVSVVLRKDLVKKLGWKVGDEVRIFLDDKGNERIFIEKKSDTEY